tara:strand:- start:6725 stop:8890 length:2166 start_codon:yes stop_codon:yes gene_type:complete
MTSGHCHYSMGGRPDPEPCRPQDLGKFEIISRDGEARIGRLHTKHGILQTPMLLPVINPNIRTIEPREMWDKYRVNGLITNSYVTWKHDDLRQSALDKGIHSLLDYPGVIVTDSGTFQSYVYGDIEVEPGEIVDFQRDIGVDIGTMLDVFGRPDMSLEELELAVEETAKRAEISLKNAGEKLLLNGPIQGGLYEDLRSKAGFLMGSAKGDYRGFAVHPIGGIVPLMEQQRYRELFHILLAAKSTIPPNKPIHLFGCGHPLLFPLSIALGVDLFDSAAYALFARDDRILTPEGTVKLAELNEWPCHSSALFPYTPAEVREMDKDDRSTLLAHHNLEITQAELARCREAVRKGKIWQLAEERSHCSSRLREAFEWVIEQIEESDEGPVGESALRLISTTDPVRGKSEQLSVDIDSRPHILHLNALLATRWRKPGSWWDGSEGSPERVAIISGVPPPWRETAIETVVSILLEKPRSIILIATPIGLVPFSLEDVSPWCHIDCSDSLWENTLDEYELNIWLDDLGIENTPIEIFYPSIEFDLDLDKNSTKLIRSWLDRCSIVDKLSLFCAISPSKSCNLTSNMSSRKSRTDRMVNVFFDEEHCLSPRLTDGALSLTLAGAVKLHEINPDPPPLFDNDQLLNELDHPGIPRVLISDDAIPFVEKGRNVIHGFVLGADSHIIVGQPCLVVDKNGSLIAHGIANSTSDEMSFFTKGIAVKIRDGNSKR